MRIEVIINQSDLSRRVWCFWIGGSIFLDTYSEEQRASKRHKWKAKEVWNRLTFAHPSGANRCNKPAVNDRVKELLLNEFAKLVHSTKEW